MNKMEPRVGGSTQSSDDWFRVMAWMDDIAVEYDDVETLGTGDAHRELREVR